jgi:hypothetical protein
MNVVFRLGAAEFLQESYDKKCLMKVFGIDA